MKRSKEEFVFNHSPRIFGLKMLTFKGLSEKCLHAYMHLDGYFSVIWKAVTLNFTDKNISSLYIVLLLGMRIMH